MEESGEREKPDEDGRRINGPRENTAEQGEEIERGRKKKSSCGELSEGRTEEEAGRNISA